MITFTEGITKLLEAEKVNGWNIEMKESWAKLGFDEFLHNFKLAIPKNYP